VIVTERVGAGGDLVKDGLNGFIYPSGDIEALAGKLKLLLQDRQLRERMGKASSEMISSWGFDQDLDGLFDCLRALGSLGSEH
jgi:glycosyltransferase involved in cell wall biosynthesis